MTDLNTVSNIESDFPMPADGKDLYDRKRFAVKLANAFANHGAESIVVGLEGTWGSGKSTVLNFLESHIKHLERNLSTQQTRSIILRFNPWWFGGSTDLKSTFFLELTKSIAAQRDESTRTPDEKKIRNALGGFAALLLVTTGTAAGFALGGPYGAYVGFKESIKPADDLRNLIEKLLSVEIDDNVLTGTTLVQQKQFVENLLRDFKTPIWVFIDDVDRLSPDEALGIVTLIRGFGNLPYVRYVLAYERVQFENRIADAFGSKSVNGRDFLGKIIQVSFDIPNPVAWRLRIQMREALEKILNQREVPQDMEELIKVTVGTLIQTPRDLTRLMNAFRMVRALSGADLHAADLLALELLRLEYPNFYERLRELKKLFVDEKGSDELDSVKLRRDALIKEHCPGSDHQTEGLRGLLELVYPRVSGTPRKPTTQHLRASDPKGFDSYFERGVETFLLHLHEIQKLDQAIKFSDSTQLESFVLDMNKQSLETDFVEWLNSGEFDDNDIGHGINTRVRLVTARLYEQAQTLDLKAQKHVIDVFLKIADRPEMFDPPMLKGKVIRQQPFIEAVGKFLASFILLVKDKAALVKYFNQKLNSYEAKVAVVVTCSYLKLKEAQDGSNNTVFKRLATKLDLFLKNYLSHPPEIQAGLLLPFLKALRDIDDKVVRPKKLMAAYLKSQSYDTLVKIPWSAVIDSVGKPVFPSANNPFPDVLEMNKIHQDLYLYVNKKKLIDTLSVQDFPRFEAPKQDCHKKLLELLRQEET